jgi:hypothetical protein
MAKRLAVFAYGLVSYLAFFLTFVYAVGFIGNLYVPKSMDAAARMSFLPIEEVITKEILGHCQTRSASVGAQESRKSPAWLAILPANTRASSCHHANIDEPPVGLRLRLCRPAGRVSANLTLLDCGRCPLSVHNVGNHGFQAPDQDFHSAAAGSFARNSFAVVTSGRSGSAFFQSVRNC